MKILTTFKKVTKFDAYCTDAKFAVVKVNRGLKWFEVYAFCESRETAETIATMLSSNPLFGGEFEVLPIPTVSVLPAEVAIEEDEKENC